MAFALIIIICIMTMVYLIIDIPSSTGLVLNYETHNKTLIEKKEGDCIEYIDKSTFDVSKPLTVSVWNIYKQQRAGWKLILDDFAQADGLILLQEAKTTPEFIKQIEQVGWHSDQAYAFAMNGAISGVMTLSNITPEKVCAYTKAEPYLRLPKSALYSQFKLSNGELLSVINLHSINFTYGIGEYNAQLQVLLNTIRHFNGPVIIAGDFNTWSQARLTLVKNELHKMGMMEAHFTQDERLTVFSYPLDHIFYRGLSLNRALSKETSASDHAWLQASFSFLDKK